MQRNYGSNYGDLYKPDSMNFGGGPEAGQMAHTLRTDNDVQLHVYLRSYTLDTEGWSALDRDTAMTMQEDVNHLLAKLKEE